MAASSPGGRGGMGSLRGGGTTRDSLLLLPSLAAAHTTTTTNDDNHDLVSALKAAEKASGAIYFDVSTRATRRRFIKGGASNTCTKTTMRLPAPAVPNIEPPPPDLMKRFAKVSTLTNSLHSLCRTILLSAESNRAHGEYHPCRM